MTPNLLSTEMQYIPLIQITLNPPIAAVSRKSEAVYNKKCLSWNISYVHANDCLTLMHAQILKDPSVVF